MVWAKIKKRTFCSKFNPLSSFEILIESYSIPCAGACAGAYVGTCASTSGGGGGGGGGDGRGWPLQKLITSSKSVILKCEKILAYKHLI